MTIDEAIKNLKDTEGHVAIAVWSRPDVMETAEGMGVTLNDEECDQILDNVDRKQDCSIGITWDVIEFWVGEFRDERDASKELVK